MDKLNFFDFIAYIVPGGTFLFVVLMVLRIYFPVFDTWITADASYTVLPFIIFAYLIGHLFNSLGKIFEDTFFKQMPLKQFFEKDPKTAKELSALAEELIGFSLAKEGKDYNPGALKLFYSRAADYLEMNDKTTKIDALSSQRLFFRNSAMMFLVLAMAVAMVWLIELFGAQIIRGYSGLYRIIFIVSLVTFYPCYAYSRQKLTLIIRYTFWGFMALRKGEK
jgi:hypothetical protein